MANRTLDPAPSGADKEAGVTRIGWAMRKPKQYGPRPTTEDQARLDKSRDEYFAKNNEALRLLRRWRQGKRAEDIGVAVVSQEVLNEGLCNPMPRRRLRCARGALRPVCARPGRMHG